MSWEIRLRREKMEADKMSRRIKAPNPGFQIPNPDLGERADSRPVLQDLGQALLSVWVARAPERGSESRSGSAGTTAIGSAGSLLAGEHAAGHRPVVFGRRF